MQIKNTAKEYDVIIVGSGAGGGMATKILSEAGLSSEYYKNNINKFINFLFLSK